MDHYSFNIAFKAWLIGLAVAAPVGPIGVLCIRRTIFLGFKGAMVIALSAAVADSVFVIIASLCSATVDHSLAAYEDILVLCVGVVLLYLSYREFYLYEEITPVGMRKKDCYLKLAWEVFALTLSNPLIVFLFVSLFSVFSEYMSTTWVSIWLIVGVFLGSITWWVVLGCLLDVFGRRLSNELLSKAKYISSGFLLIFGFIFIGSFLKGVFF